MDLQTSTLLTEEDALEEEFKRESRDKIVKSSQKSTAHFGQKSAYIHGAVEDLLTQCFIYDRNLKKAWLEEVKKHPQHLPDSDPDSFLMVSTAVRRLLRCLSKTGLCRIDYRAARDRLYPDRRVITEEGYTINKRWRDEQIAYRKWRGRTTKYEVQKAKEAGDKPWLRELEMEDRLRLRKKLP